MPQNKVQELEHAKKILHHPEFYWNSGTDAGYKGSMRRAEWIVSRTGLRAGQQALEIGCGTGFFSQVFLRSGARLHAIDLSADLLQKATERCGAAADFRVCDVEALPYEMESFDAVVGVRVLHHLDLEPAFAEIWRTLKPGGVIAFCEPNMLNPQIMIQKNIPFIKRLMGDTPDETAFFKWPMKRFLKQKGFQDISITPFDFLHPWIPGALVRPAEQIGSWMETVPLVREIAGSLAIFARKPGR
ncbi:MAG: methyltransferase domain-containing protein [Candidatus Omnitrophica bacterium]|nr:methyltransferase domain-containing protein [Candidatus Omnitrophota bacterium]